MASPCRQLSPPSQLPLTPPHILDVPSEDPGGVVGKTLALQFFSNEDFFVIQEFQIRAVPIADIPGGK